MHPMSVARVVLGLDLWYAVNNELRKKIRTKNLCLIVRLEEQRTSAPLEASMPGRWRSETYI
jgi:hypothetical protein